MALHARSEGHGDERAMTFAKALRQESVERLADRLGGLPTKDLFRSFIEVNYPMAFVDGYDRVGRNRQNSGEHRVRCVSLVLESLALRKGDANEALTL